MADRLLRMGRLGRPHGVKGEIGVDWQGKWQPRPGDAVRIGQGESGLREWRVESTRRHNGRLLLKLADLDDRTEAGKLTGALVFADRAQAGEPEADEAFVEDLAGSRVFLPDGSYLGELDHVEFPAGQMIWAIMDEEGREILFPAEPCFIRSLDMDKREAVIEPPPGLLDIYRA